MATAQSRLGAALRLYRRSGGVGAQWVGSDLGEDAVQAAPWRNRKGE